MFVVIILKQKTICREHCKSWGTENHNSVFCYSFPILLFCVGKLLQRWILKTVSCRTINQVTATRLYNTNITLDIRSIIQSTAICLFADCHAIFYLRNYWHAGIFHWIKPFNILSLSVDASCVAYLFWFSIQLTLLLLVFENRIFIIILFIQFIMWYRIIIRGRDGRDLIRIIYEETQCIFFRIDVATCNPQSSS